MKSIEKLAETTNAIPDPRGYVIEMATLIPKRNGLSPDEVSSHVEEYGNRCAQLLSIFDYAKLPAVTAEFEQKVRQLKLKRPSEARQAAVHESVYARASAAGWLSAETDALLSRVDPSQISSITWFGAKVDGRELSRAELRESLRTAAYSDEGWRHYLSTLPPITAPEVLR
ncbi:MAG: hypothetical protein IVW54_16265 [Candidatus Binataceae bacterium]|nr:hypothetical protein [Candidatus Binataceae bacterium]